MVSELQEIKTKLENELKIEKLKEKTIRKEENTLKDLKNRIKLLEELNEIVLGEFRMIEKSKNDLIFEWNQTNREIRPDLLVQSKTSAEFEKKFDQIMKRRQRRI
uniref:Uncharacterized protein n=1 Tax=Panagrolaimus sp. JU765 TaxID=591449 RepID=A0AC34QIA3_9BILA